MSTMRNALDSVVQIYQQGDLDGAERECRQALGDDGGNADLWCMLGIICRAKGAPEEAIKAQQEALRLRPDFIEALNNLGNALVSLKRFQEAIGYYERVLRIRPGYAEAYNNMGAAQRSLDRLEDAHASYRQAIALKPDFANAHCNLGDVLNTLGRQQEAIDSYEHALRFAPDHSSALSGIGNALVKLGRVEEAIAWHEHALRIKPDSAEAHNNLGNALLAQKRYADALTCYERALRNRPHFAVACYNRGIAESELGRTDAAIASFEQALALDPSHRDALESLGAARLHQGEPDAALALFERALEAVPSSPSGHMGRALVWLLKGEYAKAWPEYEWRWKCKEFTTPAFTQPAWDGSDLAGRTILLYAEQGLGDTLQMIRYAALVAERGGRVLFACQKPLVPLLSRTPGIDRIFPNDQPPPPFDVHAPLLSLPRLFGTTTETVPANTPYVNADPALVEHWKNVLATHRGLRVGIAWQGNPQFAADRHRSFPLAQLEPLARVPGVQLFSLQKGLGTDQIRELAGQFSVVDLASTLDEEHGPFMDTAAVMQNLDLVICPNTALAHLAGALGVPLWLALSAASEWRWLLGREDSPWYPSARLFRQTRLGDWTDAFERMADALRSMPLPKRGPRPILVEQTAGELLDAIAALEVLFENTDSAEARERAEMRLLALCKARDEALDGSDGLTRLARELKRLHEDLWLASSELRLCEERNLFGPQFVELARRRARLDEEREALVSQVNDSFR